MEAMVQVAKIPPEPPLSMAYALFDSPLVSILLASSSMADTPRNDIASIQS
jgi:hypothetical protein